MRTSFAGLYQLVNFENAWWGWKDSNVRTDGYERTSPAAREAIFFGLPKTSYFVPARRKVGVELCPVGLRFHRSHGGTDRPIFQRHFRCCASITKSSKHSSQKKSQSFGKSYR